LSLYKFAAAAENELIVFGAARPGYPQGQVDRWIEFMQARGIQRVCCLLEQAQLGRYSGLLETYQTAFGSDRVCWAPIKDFSFAAPEQLRDQILPFLSTADRDRQPVVVHCAGGIGRTGHVLAAWLVAGRGFSSKAAIAAVRRSGRNPREAVAAALFRGQNPWRAAAQLDGLLEQCEQIRKAREG
jgi:protein-tyrosine phosphatase